MLTNTWDWIRILGFLSYFYFTLSAVFGIMRKSAWLQRRKNVIFHLHTYAGWLGLFTLIGHMLLLLVSRQSLSVLELLIPFLATHHKGTLAMGIIAFYCFVVTLYLSDIRIFSMKFVLWKKLHFIVFPAWVLSLLHGIFIGSDSTQPFIIGFYIASVLAVGGFAVCRNKTFAEPLPAQQQALPIKK